MDRDYMIMIARARLEELREQRKNVMKSNSSEHSKASQYTYIKRDVSLLKLFIYMLEALPNDFDIIDEDILYGFEKLCCKRGYQKKND